MRWAAALGGILGAGFDVSGEELVPYPVVPEFQVSSVTIDSTVQPAVSWGGADPLFAWLRRDLDTVTVAFRWFDSAGNPLASEGAANGSVDVQTCKRRPSVAADAAGNFVVAWDSYDTNTGVVPDQPKRVRGQRFDSLGVPLGSPFDVFDPIPSARNAPTLATPASWTSRGTILGSENGVRVAANDAGEFVIAAQAGAPRAQKFSSSGNRVGPSIQLGTPDARATPFAPSVAIDEQGGFVVTWQNPEASYYLLSRAQRFDSTGSSVSSSVQVGSTIGPQTFSEVASDAQGNFVVVWREGVSGYGRRFDSSANPLGSAFTVSGRGHPAVGSSKSGSFVVVWDEAVSGNSPAIFGRRYDSSGALQGTTFQVNTGTLAQDRPRVAVDDAGTFTVVWYGKSDSDYVRAQDVFGRRYTSSGLALGAEFRVNTFTSAAQTVPNLAASGDGTFVVVWQTDGQNRSAFGISAQRFNSQGQRQGSELAVLDTFSEANKSDPSVAADATGRFALVWTAVADGDRDGVFAQQFDSQGVPAGPIFQVNQAWRGRQVRPVITSSASGDLAIVWQSYDGDDDFVRHYLRLYSSSGSPLGGEIQVNSDLVQSTGSGTHVALNDAGRCVVAWGTQDATLARRFDSAGNPIGPAFTVTANGPGSAGVGIDDAGGFVVAWPRFESGVRSIWARRFASSGTPLGTELRVSSNLAVNAYPDGMSMDHAGSFVVVWESKLAYSNYEIRARYFDPADNAAADTLVSVAPFRLTQASVSMEASAARSPSKRFVVTWSSGDNALSTSGRVFALGTPTPRFVPAMGDPARSGAGRFGAIVFAMAILLVRSSGLRRRISSRAANWQQLSQ